MKQIIKDVVNSKEGEYYEYHKTCETLYKNMKKENKGKIIFENESNYKRLLKYERDKWFKYGGEETKEELKKELKKIQELADKEQCLETDIALQKLIEKL